MRKGRRTREDMLRKTMSIIIQCLSLICLVVVVYVIGRTFLVNSEEEKAKIESTTRRTEEATTQEEIEITEATRIQRKTEEKSESKTTGTTRPKNTKNTRVTARTRDTTEATQETEAEISTKYGPETNQDGDSVDWILEQRNVIELEKEGYDLRSKGKAGIQYIDPNGDVAKTLLPPEDSVSGKSYEEYYYQGDELIFAEIWEEEQEGFGEQYYFNNKELIQWVDNDGLVHNSEQEKDFAKDSDWKKYLVAGQNAMKLSREGVSITNDTTSSSASTSSGDTTSSNPTASSRASDTSSETERLTSSSENRTERE